MRDRVLVRSVQRSSELRRPALAKDLGGSVTGAFEEHEQGAGAQAGTQNALEKELEVPDETRGQGLWGRVRTIVMRETRSCQRSKELPISKSMSM